MSKSSDLPDLWTHEPHSLLEFKPGELVADIKTNSTPGFEGSKKDAPDLQDERNGRFAELQEMLYAGSRQGDTRSVLLVLQGMDTAGKGGIVKHVVGAGNPQGIKYASFGKPTEEELAHDYLWRIRNALPPAGHIGVFDRSHYEDVLIVRVHDLVPPDVWGARYDEINAFEKELVDGGTSIVKVAMFVSLDEQKAAPRQTIGQAGQVLEVQPRRPRRARCSGRSTRRPTRPCWTARPPSTRPGTSFRATASGTPAWRLPSCMIEALDGLDLSWPPADFDVDAEKARLAEGLSSTTL